VLWIRSVRFATPTLRCPIASPRPPPEKEFDINFEATIREGQPVYALPKRRAQAWWRASLGSLVLLLLGVTIEARAADTDLAKQSQNPIGNMISVPFQNTTYFDMGPSEKLINSMNIQPVYPMNFGKVNLINRGIIPLMYLEGQDVVVTGQPPLIGGGGLSVFPGTDDDFGLGNITYQAFFSPAAPGKTIWGVGPVFELPTNSDEEFGTDTWSAGPGFVVLAMPGNWVVGGLAYNVWSFAEDGGEPDINKLVAQYFLNYNFANGWYASSTPTLTADWEADSDDRWTIPLGGGVGRLVRFGKAPVDFKAQVFYNIEAPKNVGDWSFQFQVKLLFPK
jgi:hypothetical protein